MKKTLTFLLILIFVLSFAPVLLAAEAPNFDRDLWFNYFCYDDELYEAQQPQRCETATKIYFGKKSDYESSIAGITGVNTASGDNENIRIYESGTVYYVLAEDDGSIVFPESCAWMFDDFTELTEIVFGSNIDTSNVSYMYCMFSSCEKLTDIDLSCFVFGEGITTDNISDMFYESTGLVSITFPAGTDMSLFTAGTVGRSGKKFCGWYTDSGFTAECTSETLSTALKLYPKFEDKAVIELDTSIQNYVLQSADDIAVFNIVGKDVDYAGLEGFEITYYIPWFESEATSESGADCAGDFDIEIYRAEDDDYAEYSSGRIENALHVSGKLIYDGNGNTSGDVPTDSNIYNSGDEFVMPYRGNLERKGYYFVGWLYGASGDYDLYAEGAAASYSGCAVKPYWELIYEDPSRDNDYTLQVDTDAIEGIQWYRTSKGKYTLKGSDCADLEGLDLYDGDIDGDVIKCSSSWWRNEIALNIGDEILEEGDTAVITFNNLPEQYSCKVNYKQQTITDNKLTVTSNGMNVYIEISSYDTETIFEIVSIDIDGILTEKLEAETDKRLKNADKPGTYICELSYLDAMYNTNASIRFSGFEAVRVSFDNNSAHGSVDSVYGLPGRTLTLPDGTGLSADGYKLIGWNTKSDGTGEFYPLGSEYTLPDKDVTLYARWTFAYSDPEYTWSEDHKSCTASIHQLLNPAMKISETAEAVMTAKDGLTICEAEFEYAAFEKQTYQMKAEDKKEEKEEDPGKDVRPDDKKEDEDVSEPDPEKPSEPEEKQSSVVLVGLAGAAAGIVAGAALAFVILKKRL